MALLNTKASPITKSSRSIDIEFGMKCHSVHDLVAITYTLIELVIVNERNCLCQIAGRTVCFDFNQIYCQPLLNDYTFKMAPPRKIVRRQLEIMIDFLEENKDMSKGIPPSSPMTHHTIKENWIKLTKRLNGIEGGAKKAPDGWKKYWFEWRHRCRKKAANSRRFQTKNTSGSHRFVPLNDLEVRVLDLNGKGSVSATISSSKKLENFLQEDSDSDHAVEDAEPMFPDITQSIKRKSITDSFPRSGTPPPKWALELEDRRIAAEERMANALESIANSMRLQEERQNIVEERIADALTAIAGTLQDLSPSSQKNVLQHLHHSQPDHNETSMKDVIFL